MVVWLGGAGRTDADLARLLRESNGGKDAHYRNRRTHERHDLSDAYGELIHQGSKTPCQILEISQGGCSVQTEKPFRPGALAPVEVVLPILGMVLRIGGITQWMNKERQIGVRFTHASSMSKRQLGGLMSCLRGQCTAEFVRETIASSVLNLATGQVLALQPPDANPATSDLPEPPQPYDPLVHCGQGRLRSQMEGEWPAMIRSPDDRFHYAGALADLSVAGCTVRTAKKFAGELHDPMEVDFEIQSLHFLLGGVTQAVYNPQSVGIQFKAMARRKREELALVIEELCAATNTPLEVI
jgi:hypothetical protein